MTDPDATLALAQASRRDNTDFTPDPDRERGILDAIENYDPVTWAATKYLWDALQHERAAHVEARRACAGELREVMRAELSYTYIPGLQALAEHWERGGEEKGNE